ncbi:MAG: transposase [Clostridiales Family XIII bacterium]|jgi:transposase-like protein|nr:transposase [Clostridiales Family XIII bacterium]
MAQRSYTAEYRANAVALAKEMGGSAAARQLKIPADTLYTWISRAKNGDLPMSAKEIAEPSGEGQGTGA